MGVVLSWAVVDCSVAAESALRSAEPRLEGGILGLAELRTKKGGILELPQLSALEATRPRDRSSHCHVGDRQAG